MPKHDVSFSLPSRALGKADVTFQVKKDGKVFGTLAVSNGSIVWFPKNMSYGTKMSWTDFDRIIQKEGAGVEKR